MQNELFGHDLTSGNLLKNLVRFSVPYFISSFLQSFYGLADLFIVGRFSDVVQITGVSIGSQVMHFVTLLIVGLVMGVTVRISTEKGAGNVEKTGRIMGNAFLLFGIFAVVFTAVFILTAGGIISILSTPEEAYASSLSYLKITFAGIPFIVFYNVISGIFRGYGNSRDPMIFVALSGIINIVLDLILVGVFGMGAAGAALATTAAQGFCMLISAVTLYRNGIRIRKEDIIPDSGIMKAILVIGIPIATQDAAIQISFLVITAIANTQGLIVAASVGIVEKMIGFLFLVPSAMLASISAMVAQNAGAGLHDNGRKILKYGLRICLTYGLIIAVVCEILSAPIIGMFTDEPMVILSGSQYFRVYVFDVVVAAIHFNYSGYFTAYGKSFLSFIHNVISAFAVRIPIAYLAVTLFPETLYPLGAASPAGSIFSSIFCIIVYRILKKKEYFT